MIALRWNYLRLARMSSYSRLPMPIPEESCFWVNGGMGCGYRLQKVNENISDMVKRYNRALDQIFLKGLIFF
jgi:hypothetical protein